MRGLRARVAAADDAVLRVEGTIIGLLVAAMTAIVFAQVVFRYVLASPLVWSEELARYLFVWVTMLGAAAAVHLGQHYGLDILAKALPGPLKAGAGIIGSAIIATVAVTLVWQGVKETAGATTHFASSLEIPMAWFYVSIPIGGALMIWHLFARLAVIGIGASPLTGHEAEPRAAGQPAPPG